MNAQDRQLAAYDARDLRRIADDVELELGLSMMASALREHAAYLDALRRLDTTQDVGA